MRLKTNWKNFVWSGAKRYKIEKIDASTSRILDVTPYDQEGDSIGALELNEICEQINQNTDAIEDLSTLFDGNTIAFGDVLIEYGTLSITPSLGNNPYYQSAAVTFPEAFTSVPFVITSSGNGYSDVKNTASYNVTATGFSAFMSSTGQTARTVKWLAIGKR